MAITKRLRLAFYLLVTLEVVLLSGYYAWGRAVIQGRQTGSGWSDTTSYPSR